MATCTICKQQIRMVKNNTQASFFYFCFKIIRLVCFLFRVGQLSFIVPE